MPPLRTSIRQCFFSGIQVAFPVRFKKITSFWVDFTSPPGRWYNTECGWLYCPTLGRHYLYERFAGWPPGGAFFHILRNRSWWGGIIGIPMLGIQEAGFICSAIDRRNFRGRCSNTLVVSGFQSINETVIINRADITLVGLNTEKAAYDKK